MSNKYTIIINNRTGSPQNYNLFSEKPEIVGVVKSSIWSNIYQVAEATPDGAIAQFEMWKRYYAIVGTWRGGEKAGAKVSITQTRGVTLGTKAGDDSDVPGTTLNMSVVNGVTPSFEKAPAESSAWNNAYEVDTGNDFTLDVATESEYRLLPMNFLYANHKKNRELLHRPSQLPRRRLQRPHRHLQARARQPVPDPARQHLLRHIRQRLPGWRALGCCQASQEAPGCRLYCPRPRCCH